MSVLQLVWELRGETGRAEVERYCRNCGRKVLFVDSGLRRRNANGRDIYEYAIYKCEKGHTWNEFVRTYKAEGYEEDLCRTERHRAGAGMPEKVRLAGLRESGIGRISIFLEVVEGRMRLDRVLAEQFDDCSRAQVERMIRQGSITVDGKLAKPAFLLRGDLQIEVDILADS